MPPLPECFRLKLQRSVSLTSAGQLFQSLCMLLVSYVKTFTMLTILSGSYVSLAEPWLARKSQLLNSGYSDSMKCIHINRVIVRALGKT